MKVRYLLVTIFILVTVCSFTSCGETDVSQLYDDIYGESTEFGLDEKKQIINRFDEAGLSAVDVGNQINMSNWKDIDEFCSRGEDGNAVVYVINDDGSYTQYDLSLNNNDMHVNMKVCSVGESPEVTYEQAYDAVYWEYTDKGYLFFGAEHPSGDFGAWLETTIRIKPMDEKMRSMTQKYCCILGYEDNNLFIEDWSENDFSEIDLYDIYEVLTGNITAENEAIPEDEFEAVIMRHLDITPDEIRSMTRYDSGKNVYYFSSRTADAKGSTPDMPYPEVVSAVNNGDGTITLLVEAVWPKYKEDTAFVHEVTIRPECDGFKFVSNEVIENGMGTKWYVER